MGEALWCKEVAASDWPALAKGFTDLGFEQSATYGVAGAARIGARPLFLAIENAQGCVAAAHLRLKTLPGLGLGIAWAPGGPLCCPKTGLRAPLENILCALRDYIGEKGHILRLRLPVLAGHDPEKAAEALQVSGFHPTDLAAGFQTVLVDLADGEDALLARLHGKWRNALRGTWKAGLEVEIGDYDAFYPRFRKLYDEVQGDKGFDPEIDPEFYRGLSGPDFQHQTLIATHEGQDIATITVGLSGQGAVYLFGATAAAGRRVAAGNFLTWEGYRMARRGGATTYDLGGVDMEENPHVFRFKDRAGGCMAATQAWQALPGRYSDRIILGAEQALRRLKTRRRR